MARVLISSIGTGKLKAGFKGDISDRKYDNATYKFVKDDKIFKTSFLAAALAQYIEVDKIIFIGTAKSMWEEIYRYFTEESGRELNYEYWYRIAELATESNHENSLINNEELKETMESVDQYLKIIRPHSEGGSISLIIKYGLNENELWQNFNTIMEIVDILNDGDEIYLDITHAFRSIPLFLYLVIDFMQILNKKKIKLKGLYYGMLEATQDLGYAPVVDLNPLFEISSWIRGTHDFINYGNGYLISELIKEKEGQINESEDISSKIKNISELVNINYLTDLQNQIKNLNLLLNKKYYSIGTITYIFPLLKEFLLRFAEIQTASEFQLELSKWYFENKKYGHGYICLVESILTKLCEVYNLDLENIKNRDKVKELITNEYFIRKSDYLKTLSEKYKGINRIRNRIAHASFYQEGNYSFNSDINQAMYNYNEIKKLLNRKEINELNNVISFEEILEFMYQKKSCNM